MSTRPREATTTEAQGREGQPPFRSGFVAIVGRPNVGKSTLLNTLLRYKLSIVSHRPQTTRHKILGILSGDHYQAVFLDTPGVMYRPRDLLDQRLLSRAFEAIEDADLVVLMVEPKPPADIERRLVEELERQDKPAILAINKIDTVKKATLLPIMEEYSRLHPFKEIVPISALKLDGVDLLLDLIVRYLPQGEPYFPPDQITDRPERFLVSELVREKVFLLFGEEVPYDVAVEIDEFREASPEEGRDKDYIRAIIYVNRPSQKGMLIGRGGQALKRVGTLAREEIEALLGRPVYLDLWVKVREKWRKNPAFLKEVGY